MQLVSNDPKAPNAMAQQVRQLEERCEALGHEAIESRVELLEKSLTIARKQLEDMRRQYGGKHSICRLQMQPGEKCFWETLACLES